MLELHQDPDHGEYDSGQIEDHIDKQIDRALAAQRNAEAHGRKAASVLYVMLTEEQKTRYELAAKAAGVSMREYVVNALDAAFTAQARGLYDLLAHTDVAVHEPHPSDPTPLQVGMLRSAVNSHQMRINALEKRVELLTKYVELDHGSLVDPFEPPPGAKR